MTIYVILFIGAFQIAADWIAPKGAYQGAGFDLLQTDSPYGALYDRTGVFTKKNNKCDNFNAPYLSNFP